MSASSRPLFSIITVVYNAASTMEKALRSVLDQTDVDVEYIVIDGGSTDGTLEIIERYRSRLAYAISEPDRGIYDAWNKGLAVARGEWIAFLGADDYYVSGAISRYAKAIAGSADAQVEYVSSKVAFVKDGRTVRIYGGAWQWPLFGKWMNVGHVGSMHRRSLFDRLGRYDDSYRVCGDYEMLLRAKGTLRTLFFDEITAMMSVEGASNSQLWRSFVEMARAKTETGGRAAWLSRFESAWGYVKARLRSVLWY